jgi:hypothetical protein
MEIDAYILLESGKSIVNRFQFIFSCINNILTIPTDTNLEIISDTLEQHYLRLQPNQNKLLIYVEGQSGITIKWLAKVKIVFDIKNI